MEHDFHFYFPKNRNVMKNVRVQLAFAVGVHAHQEHEQIKIHFPARVFRIDFDQVLDF